MLHGTKRSILINDAKTIESELTVHVKSKVTSAAVFPELYSWRGKTLVNNRPTVEKFLEIN